MHVCIYNAYNTYVYYAYLLLYLHARIVIHNNKIMVTQSHFK